MVTGSNYLLETSGKGQATKILIDCGLHQGSSYCEEHNFEPFPYNPKEIEAVLITHAHIDHIGRLPKLYKDGFRGKIFSSPPTKDFAIDLFLDSQHILFKEAEEKRKPPLYDIEEIDETMKLWQGIPYHKKFWLKPRNRTGSLRGENFEIEFLDAGHILGSSIIKISAEGKKIVFSGDLGNISAPLVKDTEIVDTADYAVIESTYGNRIHEDLIQRKDILEDAIEETVKSDGVLMIPAFAMERTQDLLFELNSLVEGGRIPKVPIFIDSPLAIKVTSVYKKYSGDPNYFDEEALSAIEKGERIFGFPGLKTALTTEESKAINDVPAPKVIIAGAGMSQGGRILHHEKRYLSGPKNTLLFIGYQAEGSLGRRILDGAKSVKILGEEVPVRCRVKAISGYSAHADQPKLLGWLRPMRLSLKKVFVVQGEEDQSIPFAGKIRDELAIPAIIPSEGDSFVL